jgi:3-oxocholest-4-en-26-oyl-CoA dehydrogenase alpha subunit
VAEFLKLVNWKVAWSATEDRLEVADASTTKVFGTEHYMKAIQLLSEVVGESAYLVDGPGMEIDGQLDHYLRGLLPLTFGGGVNEVQRDLIATFGLGMPRSAR